MASSKGSKDSRLPYLKHHTDLKKASPTKNLHCEWDACFYYSFETTSNLNQLIFSVFEEKDWSLGLVSASVKRVQKSP